MGGKKKKGSEHYSHVITPCNGTPRLLSIAGKIITLVPRGDGREGITLLYLAVPQRWGTASANSPMQGMRFSSRGGAM